MPSKTGGVAVNLIAGPLGVGKTTAINHLLSGKPDDERWAVLVNEFGLVGIDAALMSDAAEAGGVEIKELAGGCICCTANIMFDVALVQLLRRKPDRLLIEPTGLATVSGILDTLARPGIKEAVKVQSVIGLLDPARWKEQLERAEVKDQVDAADILLATREDLATSEQLAAFDAWAQDLFPAKLHIGHIARGQIPARLLALPGRPARASATPATEALSHHHHHHGDDHQHHHHGDGHQHHHLDPHEHPLQRQASDEEQPDITLREHRSSAALTVGWVCKSNVVFDMGRVTEWVRRLSEAPGFSRLKAVLRTTEGRWAVNLAAGASEVRPTGYRRDSRVELVLEGSAPFDPADLDEGLRACLASAPAEVEDSARNQSLSEGRA